VVADFALRHLPVAETRALRRRVLRPHQTLEEIASEEPAGGYAVGAMAGRALVAVGIIAPGDVPGVWRVRGMATEPAARGQGAGGAVLDALVARAISAGAVRVWCNARIPAVSLYERAGFRPTSDAFELPQIGPHVVMELRLERAELSDRRLP
jgi:GNAT superfamily N-acetyltransferase